MKALITVLIIVGAVALAWKLMERWEAAKEKERTELKQQTTSGENSGSLPGMDPSLESALDIARRRGAIGYRDFLARYGKTIKDPRLAAIELDYAALLMKENPAEAKRVFNRVRSRTPSSSPVYQRIKQVERAYQ